jgi:hypothetical protein
MGLPSIETTLKKIVAAMNALETPDLSKTEIARQRCIIQAARFGCQTSSSCILRRSYADAF